MISRALRPQMPHTTELMNLPKAPLGKRQVVAYVTGIQQVDEVIIHGARATQVDRTRWVAWVHLGSRGRVQIHGKNPRKRLTVRLARYCPRG